MIVKIFLFVLVGLLDAIIGHFAVRAFSLGSQLAQGHVSEDLGVLGEGLHQLQSLVLLGDIPLFGLHRRLVLVLLLVDALAFPLQTFLVLFLFVVEIVLEAAVHAKSGVEAILDCVVRPAWHVFSDHGPLFTILLVQLHQVLILLKGPLFLHYLRVKVIVVTLSALFAGAAWQLRRDVVPALSTVLLNELEQFEVFLLGPGTLLATLHLILLLERYFAEILRYLLSSDEIK